MGGGAGQSMLGAIANCRGDFKTSRFQNEISTKQMPEAEANFVQKYRLLVVDKYKKFI